MRIIDDREYLMPPDNEAVKVYDCDLCGGEIFEGDDCFNIDGLIYCEECIDRHFKIIAENPDMEGYLADLEFHDIR